MYIVGCVVFLHSGAEYIRNDIFSYRPIRNGLFLIKRIYRQFMNYILPSVLNRVSQTYGCLPAAPETAFADVFAAVEHIRI